jgi:hypothetical protein
MARRLQRYGLVTGSVNMDRPGYRTGFSSAIAWLGLAGTALTLPQTVGIAISGEAGEGVTRRRVNRGMAGAIVLGQIGMGYLYYKYLRRPKDPK